MTRAMGLVLFVAAAAACRDQPAFVEARAPTTCPDGSDIVDLPSERAPVGEQTPFELRLTPRCDEARAGRVTWERIEGYLASHSVEEGGFVLRGVAPKRVFPDAPWGIVPISPRTQGLHAWKATWTGPTGARLEKTIRFATLARASGVASIAEGQELVLGGSGWHLHSTAPKNGRFDLEPRGDGLFRFRPTTSGQFVLQDGAGRPLSIRAGKHEKVPLDCARSDCHVSAGEAVQTSAMTHVLREGLEGRFGRDFDASCAIACHAVGEPGLDDSGFAAVRREMGFTLPVPHGGAWDELPRSLRRLGGVGCTACHGPASIPEPTARFASLRADVCATCHDAPPRYGHVVAWKTSSMAHSDRDERARHEPACQKCHTTAGFLRTLSNLPREDAPDRVGPVGIACAACHAPHASHGVHLVREVPVDARFATLDAASRVCVPCHQESAALVWAGTPEHPSPHAAIGCVGCHMAPSPSDRLGTSHSFRAEQRLCPTCHAGGVPASGRALEVRLPAVPAHASGPAPAAQRALRAVQEDRGRFVHNAPFARSVLAAAR